MTHNRHLFRPGSEGKPQEHVDHHGGGGKHHHHRSRKHGFKLRKWIPWHFIVGVLAGLAAAWLVTLLFVNNPP